MTKEELEKATGMELIEQRNFCGVDGYYGDYILDVNAEMLKRLNRLKELEKENTEQIEQLTKAKEIIRGLLNSCFGYNSKTVNYEVKVKAEQFLKEVS